MFGLVVIRMTGLYLRLVAFGTFHFNEIQLRIDGAGRKLTMPPVGYQN